jgi:hypothetical protein
VCLLAYILCISQGQVAASNPDLYAEGVKMMLKYAEECACHVHGWSHGKLFVLADQDRTLHWRARKANLVFLYESE